MEFITKIFFCLLHKMNFFGQYFVAYSIIYHQIRNMFSPTAGFDGYITYIHTYYRRHSYIYMLIFTYRYCLIDVYECAWLIFVLNFFRG